jgi:deoxyribose-phosphate aldolase
MTRKELEELVGTITAEVLRQVKPSPFVEVRAAAKPAPKDEACEGCPRNPGPAKVDPRTIRLTEDVRALAALIDHTLLRPQATRAQIESLCDEALQMGFAAVCVNPVWVPVTAEKLRGSGVRVATVVGFPFGATSTAAKRAEAEAAIVAGAKEVDMVMNVGAMKSGDTARVESDIRGVVEVCHARGAAVKVILENGYLTDQEKVVASKIVKQAGADFVKTSTGFGPSGATEADVRLMRETVGPLMGVKAAGGIRNLADALRMLQAGATRLGASSSLAILAEAAALMN